MYMHIGGRGDPAQLAKVLHDALALSGTPLSAPTAASPAAPEKIDLDTAALDRIMGHKGKVGGGVYAFGIRVPRHRATAAWSCLWRWDRPSQSTFSRPAVARRRLPATLCSPPRRSIQCCTRCARTASR